MLERAARAQPWVERGSRNSGSFSHLFKFPTDWYLLPSGHKLTERKADLASIDIKASNSHMQDPPPQRIPRQRIMHNIRKMPVVPTALNLEMNRIRLGTKAHARRRRRRRRTAAAPPVDGHAHAIEAADGVLGLAADAQKRRDGPRRAHAQEVAGAADDVPEGVARLVLGGPPGAGAGGAGGDAQREEAPAGQGELPDAQAQLGREVWEAGEALPGGCAARGGVEVLVVEEAEVHGALWR